jgi:hypothetical protein
MGIKTDHNALTARAAKYGISIREDGHLTKPTQYADVPDDAFADPVNYAYPMDTPEHARAALAYWGKRKDQAEYTDADRAKIEERMQSQAEQQGVKCSFSLSLDEEDAPKTMSVDFAATSPTITDVVPYAGKIFDWETP